VAAEGLRALLVVIDPAFRIPEMVVLAPEVVHRDSVVESAPNASHAVASVTHLPSFALMSTRILAPTLSDTQ
jgi:hypothetical protein